MLEDDRARKGLQREASSVPIMLATAVIRARAEILFAMNVQARVKSTPAHCQRPCKRGNRWFSH